MREGIHKVLNWVLVLNLVQHMQNAMEGGLHVMLNCRSMQNVA